MAAATGAFNASGFEYPYGFHMLDEVHNFFPELLYDDTIFSSELIAWMRYRVSTLFPSQYARNQNLYRMYQALSRQSSFRAWRSAHARSIASVTPAPAPAAAAPAPASTYTPATWSAVSTITTPTTTTTIPTLRTNTVSVPLPARTSPSTDSVVDILNAFLTMDLLQQMAGSVPTPAARMRDVRVAATPAQIETASFIAASSSVPEDQVCSICQDHGAPTEAWRVMGCSHAFHQPCIDRWFAQNVHCPICRADIRTMNAEESV